MKNMLPAALAGALLALAGAAEATQSEERPVDQRPQDEGLQDGRDRPEPDPAGGREERRGESRGVNQETLDEVRAAVDRSLPKERARRLRVYDRDGRAYVGGTVRSEAEREALRRTVFQLVSPEQAVIDVEVRPEGGP